MIKPREFRKGNYVQDLVSKEWMIIDEIGENIGATVINRDKYPLPDGWQMAPIAITPEVLKKVGFSPSQYGPYMILSVPGNPILKLHGMNVVSVFYAIRAIGKPCRYLHEVQNLYFSLTREELTITCEATV